MSSAVAAAKATRSERMNICTRHRAPVARQTSAQTVNGAMEASMAYPGRPARRRHEREGRGDGHAQQTDERQGSAAPPDAAQNAGDRTAREGGADSGSVTHGG